MEKFLKIKAGMDIGQVEEILNEKLVIEKRRKEHFKSDIVHFEDIGVWLFFKPETSTLYTIRYEAPYNLAVDGVQIGDTKKKQRNYKVPHQGLTLFLLKLKLHGYMGRLENLTGFDMTLRKCEMESA